VGAGGDASKRRVRPGRKQLIPIRPLRSLDVVRVFMRSGTDYGISPPPLLRRLGMASHSHICDSTHMILNALTQHCSTYTATG
jgi:hypothetical protein